MKKLSPLKAILKPALAAFKAPYGIAILASVGVHGVLFAFGPNNQVSLASFGDPTAAEDERTVPLVQLSPAEQNRVPNFSQPRFPSTFSGSTAGRLPTPSSLPPIARTPIPSALGRRTQPVTPRPSTTARRSTPVPRSGWTTFSPSPYVAGSLNLPTLPTPTPSGSANPSTPQSSSSMQEATRSSQTADPEQLSADETRQRQLALEGTDAANQAAAQAEQTGAAQQTGAEDIAESFGAPVEGADVKPDGAEPPTAETSDTEIATASTEGLSRLQQLRAELTFNPEGTSDEAAEIARDDWIAQAQVEVGEAELQVPEEPIPIAMDSNIQICVEPPTSGLIGVVVTPEGTLAGDPQVLKSTGYNNLNQAAVNTIRDTPFEASDSSIAYQFNVDVSYDVDNCVETSQILQSAGE